MQPEAVLYAATYTARNPTREVAFFAARIPRALIRAIVYGDEGQEWRMMAVAEFLVRNDAVPELRTALGRYLRMKSP